MIVVDVVVTVPEVSPEPASWKDKVPEPLVIKTWLLEPSEVGYNNPPAVSVKEVKSPSFKSASA